MHQNEHENENKNEDEDSPPGVVDNAGRAPSVSALRSGPSKFTVYETHLSAIETNA
jgi:hypothetical protein